MNIGAEGTSFFVGVMLDSNEFPLSIDENGALAHESWVVGDIAYAVDPNDLGNPAYNNPLATLDDIGLPGNWLIRAGGVAAGADCNENGVPDECDVPPIGTYSLDCNANLIPDECEDDCNANGVPDDCDVDPADPDGDGIVYPDCNLNGRPDECDIADGTSEDCNNNGRPDECDIASMTSEDCNANGIPDECDIADGTSADCQGDGIPDECQLLAEKDLILSESFEVSVPPADWSAQIQNSAFTWMQDAGGTDGSFMADVQYDPALTPQERVAAHAGNVALR